MKMNCIAIDYIKCIDSKRPGVMYMHSSALSINAKMKCIRHRSSRDSIPSEIYTKKQGSSLKAHVNFALITVSDVVLSPSIRF